METKVNLCDSCKKKIKEVNCDICGADLCENCKSTDDIQFKGCSLGKLYFCNECYNKVNVLTRESYSIPKQDLKIATHKFRPELILALKKILMIQNLK